MKALSLFALSLALAPCLYLISRGAEREHWRTVTLGASLTAAALAGIHFLLGGLL